MKGASRRSDDEMCQAGVATIGLAATGGFLAWLVYRYLARKFMSRSWFNAIWAVSLILACDQPTTLARWAAWHRARVFIVVAAFGLSLVTLVA